MNQRDVFVPVAAVQSGAQAFIHGTAMAQDGAALGFAFCPHPIGSQARDCWLSGYAWAAFNS